MIKLNAVWQIHLDYMLKIILEFQLLFDEFVFDPNIEIGKEHGKDIQLDCHTRHFFPIIILLHYSVH